MTLIDEAKEVYRSIAKDQLALLRLLVDREAENKHGIALQQSLQV
jgi:hypothetical protein